MIHLEHIYKAYGSEGQRVAVLNDVSLDVGSGEFVAIMGKSGSGKSTLMNIIGLLDVVDEGVYTINQRDASKLNDNQLAKLRAQHIGFVFQSFNLLSRISVLKQVGLPFMYQGRNPREEQDVIMNALKIVGLEDKKESFPNQLSGGQQQRVAIARAIVTEPDIILADEPTGALDSKTGKDIMRIFETLNTKGKTIIMVTHDNDIAARARRIIYLKDGKVVEKSAFHHVGDTNE